MEVMVATDFSDFSRPAVRWAANLARQLETPLRVVHVVEVSVEEALVEIPAKLRRSAVENAGVRLERFYDELVAEGPDQVEFAVVLGKPVEQLIDQIEQGDDVITVVGTRGKTQEEEFFLGNAARRLVRRSPQPVVVVPPDAKTELSRRFVVGVDGSAPARKAIEWTARLARRHGAGVDAVYGYELPQMATVEEALLADIDDYDKLLDDKRDTLRQVVARLGADDVIDDVETTAESPPEALVGKAAEQQAGLIFVGTHGREGVTRFLLGNTAERVMRKSPVPVFVTPAAGQEKRG